MEFLELDMRAPSLLNKGPNLLGKHIETRSIMDLHYWEESKMLFLVNADLSGFIQKSGLFSFGKKKEPTQTLEISQATTKAKLIHHKLAIITSCNSGG